MELPQPRPFKTEGIKPTHDFLSLCSQSTVQADPKPTSSSQSSHLKTHDFLQPLDCIDAKEETRTDTTTTASEKPPPPPPLPQHILPGGIGTYTISSIPYFHHHHQRIPKPELSPPLMYTAAAQGGGSNERTVIRSGLKSQSFMDMIRSAKGSSQDDDLDDEEDFIMKKESSSTSQSHSVELRVKPDARGSRNDQKLNTPRSKHSATEQRRRSKINDRFQMLRQLIPNSDQKRDKASFLLEVIEYIQFLQEKTNTFETPYQGWNHEPAKLLNWQGNKQQLVPEGTVAFVPKLEEEKNNVPAQDVVVVDHPETQIRATATAAPFSLSVKSNSFFSPATQFHTRIASSETVEPSPSSRSQTQQLQEDEEVHEGNISVSSIYSQGLVKTLREALENSGVDLTKASISVDIELAKQSSLLSSLKDNQVGEPVSRTGNDDVRQTRKPKRLKTDRT